MYIIRVGACAESLPSRSVDRNEQPIVEVKCKWKVRNVKLK